RTRRSSRRTRGRGARISRRGRASARISPRPRRRRCLRSPKATSPTRTRRTSNNCRTSPRRPSAQQ
ncbi:hypothetical protein LTR53_019153, partial [Teratosphaeriaceae sp. CCFEE 6253]